MVLVENELKEPLLQASKDADAVLENSSSIKKACDDMQRDEDDSSTSVEDFCPPISEQVTRISQNPAPDTPFRSSYQNISEQVTEHFITNYQNLTKSCTKNTLN